MNQRPGSTASAAPTVTLAVPPDGGAADLSGSTRDADADDATPELGPIERHIGQIVAGRYQLLHPLGEGGMGSVWAAKHLHTRKRVALKFIKRIGRPTPLARRRALREARAATVVQHPNILGVHDIIEVDGSPMLVMDIVDGASLRRHLAQRGRLPLPEAAPILLRVVSAIGTAGAAGVVHRDLKPDNILLVPLAGSSTYDVKVLDFGLAKLTATEGDAATSGDLTRDGDVIGTPHYMAPEQAFGEPVDHRADIWSLGIIIYECLAGVRPFPGDNLGQVLKRLLDRQYQPLRQAAPDVPEDVAALVDGMLAFDRAARPSDLRDAHAVLSRYVPAETDRAPSFDLPRPDEAPSASAPPPRRHASARVRWLAGVAAVLAVAAGAGGLALSRSHATARLAAPTLTPTPTGMMKPTETAPEIPVAAPAATVAAPPPPARPGRARRHHAAKGTPAAPSPRAADADENDVPLFQE